MRKRSYFRFLFTARRSGYVIRKAQIATRWRRGLNFRCARLEALEQRCLLSIDAVAFGGDDAVAVDALVSPLETVDSSPLESISGTSQGAPIGTDALAGEIRGTKWNDLDGDRVQDAGEPVMQGVTVYLDSNENGQLDAGELETLTDENGQYAFVGLSAGAYVVREVVPTGWRQTLPVVRTFEEPAGAEAMLQGRAEALTTSTTNSSAPAYLSAVEVVNGDVGIQTDISSELIGLDQFRADLRFSGIDGSGLASVVLDTGIDLDHPFFGPDGDGNGVADRIVYQYDFANGDDDASDYHGHGSNVSSIIASEDATYTGMAPGADIIQLKVFTDGGNGSFGYVEQALQWVVANAATYNIVSLNMSLGDGGNYATEKTLYGIDDELAALAGQGVIVVSSSGNSFYTAMGSTGVGYPSADPNSLSIGAVYDSDAGPFTYSTGAGAYSTDADRLTPFSQRHPSLTTVFAPGAPITGANDSGGTVTYHGTSQAAPHITGIAVLAQDLAQEYLGRRLTPAEFSFLLKDTGVLIHDGDDEDDNAVNTHLDFSRVDVVELAEAIWLMQVPPGSHLIELGTDEIVTGIDFGNQILPGQVDGIVWADANANGNQDAGELGLENVEVFVDLNDNGSVDFREPYTFTDTAGNYSFAELQPGDYTVAVVLPFGYEYTVPASGTQPVTVVTQQTTADVDFGIRDITGEIRGMAWNDLDGNGSLDAGEPPLHSLVVFADLDEDGEVDLGEPSTTTGMDGTYVLDWLLPQTYTIAQVTPEGWQQTFPPSGVHQVTVGSWQTVTGIDFANQAIPAEIRGTVRNDLDADGFPDANESGLAGVTVYMDTNYNGQYDVGEPTRVTLADDEGTPGVDETGTYAFTGLEPGRYAIGQLVPAGSIQTYPDYDQDLVERVSLTQDGGEVDYASLGSTMSDDGRYVIFQSGASNIVPGGTSGQHYYLRDVFAGVTELLTVTPTGEPGQPHNFNTFRMDVTPGGRFAVFGCDAGDLVPDDTNNLTDIFVRDRELGVTERVSLAWDGSQANGSSLGPVISDDGRYVVFHSHASNLVPNDNNGEEDVFLYDRQLRQIRLISAGLDGNPANGYSRHPDISGDGRYIAFHSKATNLVAEDTTDDVNVFLYDMQTGTLEIASRDAGGAVGAGWNPTLSTDGRFMAFWSNAVYDPGDDNGVTDVFLRDRQTGAFYWASQAYDGSAGNSYSLRAAISADGHYVTFVSDSSNLVPGDTNESRDVFLYHLDTETIERVSLSSSGGQLSDRSDNPAVSAEGRYVSFDSYAPDVVPDDTNGYADIFVYSQDTKGQHLITLVWGEVVDDADFGNLALEHATYENNDTTALKDAKNAVRPGVTTSTIEVTDPGKVFDLDVELDITHTYDGQLTATLFAPDGTPVELFSNVGGSNDNFTATVFDDDATMSILDGSPPFTGTFRPSGSLATFKDLDVAGTWTLEISDNAKGETGTLNRWSIQAATYLPPPPAGITVSPTSGLATTEDGGSDTFTVVLDSRPTGDVTIAVSSSDTGEGTVSVSSLTFTPDTDVAGGWNVPQTVTVTGVDDPDPDGSVAYTIILAPASSTDANYNGLDPADVSVTNQDNDGQGNTFESQDVPQTIADPHPKKGPRPATSELVIESTGITVDTIDVDMSVDHANMSDLTSVTLTSPGGTEASVAYDGANWDLVNGAAYYGESLDGTWTLTIVDTVKNGLTGTLNNWSLTVTPQAGASAQASVSVATIESQAVSKSVRTVGRSANVSDARLRIDPQAADVFFVESDTHPVVSDHLATAPEDVDELAFDAAIEELESDSLDGGPGAALF